MHSIADSDYHVVGILESSAPGFHHTTFEMNSIDEAEAAVVRLYGKGHKHA